MSIAGSAGLAFLFHAVAGRLLSQGDYSSLGALLALIVALAVPLGAVQAAVTKHVAQLLVAGGPASGRRVLAITAAAAAAVAIALSLAAPALAAALRLSGPVPLALAGWWLAANGPVSVLRGLLIGAGRLRPVAGSIAAASLSRLGLLIVLAPSFGLIGAVGASVLGETVGLAVALGATQRAALLGRGAPVRSGAADTGRALRLQLALWLFAGAGPILARRVLADEGRGSFAAMATAASACLFLPQAIATLALPRFVRDGGWRQLRQALLASAAVSALSAVPLCLFPQLTFGVLFGAAYRADRSVLVLLCAHMAGLGVAGVVAQYAVAHRRRAAGTIAVALAAAVLGVHQVGHGPVALAAVLAATSTPMAVVLVACARRWATAPSGLDAGAAVAVLADPGPTVDRAALQGVLPA